MSPPLSSLRSVFFFPPKANSFLFWRFSFFPRSEPQSLARSSRCPRTFRFLYASRVLPRPVPPLLLLLVGGVVLGPGRNPLALHHTNHPPTFFSGLFSKRICFHRLAGVLINPPPPPPMSKVGFEGDAEPPAPFGLASLSFFFSKICRRILFSFWMDGSFPFLSAPVSGLSR